ncbi:MAG: hypothetical protein L0Z62_19540, partial [Gemmataceae bacterium]|nr:hypothetical protein [Gemmataceae bacterium]
MSPAPGAGRACPVCDVRLQACWPFREDDQHCGLCGLRILRLAVFPTAPDGQVWLYQDPRGVLVRLVWERGLEGKPERRQALRPVIDFQRSSAHFGGERFTGLDFALEEIYWPDGPPEILTARLVPRFHGFERLELPPRGVPGQLVLACGLGTETRSALLLPAAQPPGVECTDPSVVYEGGVWHVFQQESSATLPMKLTASVAQWIVGIPPNSDPSTQGEFTLAGLETPLLLEPGKPHSFELHVTPPAIGAGPPPVGAWSPDPVGAWSPDQAPTGRRPFTFLLQRVGLDPYPLAGRVSLVPGSRLQFGGGNPRNVEVRLGRRVTVPFALHVSDGVLPAVAAPESAPILEIVEDAFGTMSLPIDSDSPTAPFPSHGPAESGITITDYVIHQGPREQDAGAARQAAPTGVGPACRAGPDSGAAAVTWLRVLKPRRAQLPWHLPATAPGQLPDQLDLEVDTTGLDRERYNGSVLRGSVELIDSRHRR